MAQFPLKTGSSGDAVKAAQRWLNLALEIAGDRDRLAEDGKYGPATARVVRSYFYRDSISESDYKLMLAVIPAMIARLKEIKATGKNPDNLMRNIASQDAETFRNLLAIYKRWESATPAERERDGRHYTTALAVAARYNARQRALKAMPELRIKSPAVDGLPADIRDIATRHAGGVGFTNVLIGLALPGVVALVIGKGAVSLYDALTPHYRSSTTDFKVTKELRAVLEKLSPEDRATVLAEGEKQVDEAYNQGRSDADGGILGGVSKTVKTVAVVAAAGLGTYLLWPALVGGRMALSDKFAR